MATNSTVRGEERRAMILATLKTDGTLQLDDVAAALGVSPMTVRRDLDDLEAEGLLRRVRGGAVAIDGPRPFDERRGVRLRAKQAIAAKATLLLPTTGAIALDASSTTGTLASALSAHPGLTVATNSYDNFSALRPAPFAPATGTCGRTTSAARRPARCACSTSTTRASPTLRKSWR